MVDEGEAEVGNGHGVERGAPALERRERCDVAVAVADEQGDLVSPDPGQALGMEAGAPVACVARARSRAHEEDVSRPDRHALAAHGGFEIGDADRRPGLQRAAAERSHIQQLLLGPRRLARGKPIARRQGIEPRCIGGECRAGSSAFLGLATEELRGTPRHSEEQRRVTPARSPARKCSALRGRRCPASRRSSAGASSPFPR
jgi:hypothetical protein